MKKSNALLLATTLGCTLLSATALAAPPMDGDKIKEEVKAMLSQHDEAMNKQDVKALMMFYADDPNVVLMGTGPGEFWKGRAAVEEAYKQFFQDFKAGTFKHECPEASSGHDGNVAWVIASCNMQDVTPDGEAREYVLNVSGVLRKEKSGWKFQTLHFSNLTGDDMPPPEDMEEAPAQEDGKPAPKAQ
ncbi:MAG: nuclear transport factor 2 family protein [Candidatus Competibacteraceae bacterium]|nr:nuclear transport factor 2 family protein [Candidatus Competibacteraceae bacterium]MCP5134421.1 nuclear transport factor 2 family protein [Gammaproteobacteria bacterium]